MKVAIFDVQDHPEPHGTCSTTGQTHALARQSVWGRWCAVLWIGCYPFLNVCIVLTAAMLEPLTLHGDLTTLAQTTISLTMASILFITASQDLLHYGGPRSTSRRISKPGRVLGRYAYYIPMTHPLRVLVNSRTLPTSFMLTCVAFRRLISWQVRVCCSRWLHGIAKVGGQKAPLFGNRQPAHAWRR